MRKSRPVMIHNNVGAPSTTLEVSSETWEELQSELKKSGVQYDKMTAVIGETSEELTFKGAKLPTESFNLFLMPMMVKSGSLI